MRRHWSRPDPRASWEKRGDRRWSPSRVIASAAAFSVLFALGVATPALAGASPSSSTATCTGVTINPGNNVQTIINAYPTATTFCINAGTYRLAAPIVPKSFDVLWGAPGAVLNGSKLLTSFTKSGSYWVASNQTQQGAVETSACLDSTYTGCKYPEGVFRDDVSLWQVTSLSQLATGKFFFDYAGDKIYLFDDPTGHKLEASFAASALIGYGSSQTGVTIKGLTVEKFASPATGQTGAVLPGTNWVFSGNEVRLNHRIGLKVNSGMTVDGNYIHDNGMMGIGVSFVNNVVLSNNEIARNNSEKFSFGNAGGVKIFTGSHITLQGNYVHDNIGNGLKTDADSIYITYDQNTIENNTGCGISHEISYDATISNNTVRNNATYYTGKSIAYGAQIQVYDSPNVDVFGNTVETLANTHGISVRDDDRGSGAYGVHEARNDTVHGNTIKLGSGGTSGIVGTDTAIYTSMGNKFTANTWYVKNLTAQDWRWSGNQTWAGWQAKGQDLTGLVSLW